MHLTFKDPETEAAILVDATNAFNNFNHQSAHINIRVNYPSFAKVIVNEYIKNSFLFIDGETILSKEGTTQGDYWPWQCMPLVS